MLIYNHQKEFIGIDESNLKTLGFSNLLQLLNEVNDFADLFVKTPGYIHNFKHIHWIDFIICVESNQEAKVIINAKGKDFSCNLDIRRIYLKEDLNNMGYAINLLNLKSFNQVEHEIAQKDMEEKFVVESDISSVLLDIVEDDYEEEPEIVEEEYVEVTQDESRVDDTISIDDFDTFEDSIKDAYEDEFLELQYESRQAPKEIKKEPLISLYAQVLELGSDYVYNPQLASDELGLPLELIEEFVQDFIAQANDFKTDLYNSLDDQNIDNVKILSHKLKGVAANLRIEDAFEVLNTVNSSEDILKLKQSLNAFYEIVDKLSSKQEPKEKMPIEENLQIKTDEDSEEEMILSFKDEVKDSDTLQMIEMPELVDDDFITLELDEDIFEHKDSDIEVFKVEQEVSEVQEDTEVQKNTQVKYDKVKAANEIGIDLKNFNELLADFIDEAKEHILHIRKAIRDSDFEASKRSSIKLKRMCESMRIDSFDEELNYIINTKDLTAIKQSTDFIDKKLYIISSMGD